jgi:hypothetical protein
VTFSTVAKLGAGSKLYFENPSAPGVWILLDNALNLGQTGEQGEFVEITAISKTVREYVRGLKTPPNKQLTFNDIPGDTNFALYLSKVDDEANVASIKHRIDYSNGRRAEFSIVTSGRVVDEADGSSQLKMLVFGQQTGSTVWSEY